MPNLDRLLPILVPALRPLMASAQAGRRSQFEALPSLADRVLFLGDSITEQGMWAEWFPELRTLNRGVGGDPICGVLARLDTAINEPRAISLLIGTNDLHGAGKSSAVVAIAAQMRELVDGIRRMAPSAPLFINSVLPRSTLFRDRIQSLNEAYLQIAVDAGATYVDVWPALAGPDGAIRRDLTSDGLHLRGAGYRAWTDVLRPHLARFAGD
jgi:lysophospholipase L1-like esterase